MSEVKGPARLPPLTGHRCGDCREVVPVMVVSKDFKRWICKPCALKEDPARMLP